MSTDSPPLAEVLDSTDAAFAVTDQRCRIRWCNPAMAELLELTVEQSVGRSLPALFAGAPDGPEDSVVVSVRPDGDDSEMPRWVDIRCTALPDGRLLYRVVDVTRWRERELRSAELGEDIVRLAEKDPLTGLANRRTLTRELEHQLAIGGSGALLLLDLDNFKDINDLRGHPAGDRVMCNLSNLLRERLGHGHPPRRPG